MKFSSLTALLLTGALFATAHASSTTVYKSVGKNGETRYSQIRPTDTNSYETMILRSDGRTADTGRMATLPDQAVPAAPVSADAQRADEAERQLKELKAQELAERCKAMRTNLAALSTGQRIYETNANGERVYLNDQEISSKKQRTADAIASECK